MNLGVFDVFILNAVVDEVRHPVEEISAIGSSESDNDFIVNRIISDETECV